MKKTKILLATLITVSLLFAFVFTQNVFAQSAGTPVAPPTAEQIQYAQQFQRLYRTGGNTGTASSPGVMSTTVGGCIGSFIGTWVASQTTGTLKSMFTPANIILHPIPTNDVNQASANYRDETLNGLAFCIGNGLIDSMTASVVQWINSGFKNPDGTSGPGFLSNPGQFFAQMADREVGNFFQALGPIGNVVCKPFDLQIRLALMNDYNGGMGRNQCSLTSIQQNFERFGTGGNYMGDWFQLTQQDNNNAIGSYFIARQKLAEGITYSMEQNKLEIDLGKGFLNFKKCKTYSQTLKDPNTGKMQCTQWETVTPGSEVQASLDRALGAKTHRIEIATNFNQIITALINQIIIQIMNGLRGDGNTGSGGSGPSKSPSSLSDILNEMNGSTTNQTATTTTYSLTVLSTGAGSGTIFGLNNPYQSGASTVITAVPASATSTFIGWVSGCTTIAGNTCSVLMDSNKTITASFGTTTPFSI